MVFIKINPIDTVNFGTKTGFKQSAQPVAIRSQDSHTFDKFNTYDGVFYNSALMNTSINPKPNVYHGTGGMSDSYLKSLAHIKDQHYSRPTTSINRQSTDSRYLYK
jgi:hypothetical protein